MYGQNIDTLEVKNKLRYKSFIVPVAFVATGAFLLNSELNGKIQIKSGRVFGSGFKSVDNIFPFVHCPNLFRKTLDLNRKLIIETKL
jgi:hypothetical protein